MNRSGRSRIGKSARFGLLNEFLHTCCSVIVGQVYDFFLRKFVVGIVDGMFEDSVVVVVFPDSKWESAVSVLDETLNVSSKSFTKQFSVFLC